MKKSKVIIFGAGGHGKVVLDILLASKMKVFGFIDDDKHKHGKSIFGIKVLGGWSFLLGKKDIRVVLGIGDNAIRQNVFKKAKNSHHRILSVIHPRAVVSKNTTIEEGVVIMAGAVINSGSVLREGAVVNTAATVDHDCYLSKFSHIWPGAHLAGNVRVGKYSYIGTGASVIENITIGNHVMIGAGAVVITNIPDNVVAVGVPARIIKENK